MGNINLAFSKFSEFTRLQVKMIKMINLNLAKILVNPLANFKSF